MDNLGTEDIPIDGISFDLGPNTKAGKAGRPKNVTPLFGGKPKLPGKKELAGLIGMANFTVAIGGMPPQLALTNDEIDRLSEALLDLLKQYPDAIKYVAVGPKLTAWANLGIVVFGITKVRVEWINATKRAGIRPQTSAGPARSPDRQNGDGQNGVSGSVPEPDTLRGSSRPQGGIGLESVPDNGFVKANPGVVGLENLPPLDFPASQS